MAHRLQWRSSIASVALTTMFITTAVLCPVPVSAQDKSADSAKKKTPPTGMVLTPDRSDYSWTHLENRLTMRAPFNELKGKVRVIVFFSPTCPRCLENAAALQKQLLAKNDSDDMRLMIVWVKSLSTDSEEKIPLAIDIIPDPRVTHFWDRERVLNPQLIDAIAFGINMNVYDVFLLYDKEAIWEKRLPRPGYFFHETKRMPGPWWNMAAFLAEMDKGLNDESFGSPW
jgi:hypothetical protein